MVEICQEERKEPRLVYVPKRKKSKVEQTTKFIPEYQVLSENLRGYQLLFRFKYLDGEVNPNRLSQLIGCNINVVVDMERNLDAYFQRVMGGNVRSELLELVCPSCFRLSLTNFGKDGEEIKRACQTCGVEILDSVSEDTFDESIDRDQTYATESYFSMDGSRGGTLDGNQVLSLLVNDDVGLSDFKKILPEVAAELSSGTEFVIYGDSRSPLKINPVSGEHYWPVYVYRLLGNKRNTVRKIDVDAFYAAYAALEYAFHVKDIPLRHSKVKLIMNSWNEFTKELPYLGTLMAYYHLENNHTFCNSVAIDVRKILFRIEVLGWKLKWKTVVDSVFFASLLKWGKIRDSTDLERSGVSNHLTVDFSILNLWNDDQEFIVRHKEPNYSRKLLDFLTGGEKHAK